MYYFPHSFKTNNNKTILNSNSGLYVNSGKNALKIIINQLSLPLNGYIAVPAFVCNSVIEAIDESGHKPYFLDFKDSISFWSNYDEIIKQTCQVNAILIVHLYGFYHPDTASILKFAEQNKIPVIHDVAQSYGINEDLFGKHPIVYSFGPGKSSTAALGGEIKNIDANLKYFTTPTFKTKIKSQLFYYSRFYNHPLSKISKFLNQKLANLLKENNKIYLASRFQINKINSVKYFLPEIKTERYIRYNILKEALGLNSYYKLCYDNNNGQYFKLIFKVKNEPDLFKKYLIKNNVPFYNLFSDIEKQRMSLDFPLFTENALHIFEISCERTIPIEEIERISKILVLFK